MSIKKGFLITILLTMAVVTGYLLYKSSFWPDFWSQKTTNSLPKVGGSVFGQKLNKLSPDVEEQYKNDPEALRIFKLGWGIDRIVGEKKEWNYLTSPFSAEVKNYDAGTQSVNVEFYQPYYMPFFEQTRDIKLPQDCTDKNSFVLDENTSTVYTNKKFIDNVAVGTYIESFCKDEACSEMHKLCRVRINVDLFQ